GRPPLPAAGGGAAGGGAGPLGPGSGPGRVGRLRLHRPGRRLTRCFRRRCIRRRGRCSTLRSPSPAPYVPRPRRVVMNSKVASRSPFLVKDLVVNISANGGGGAFLPADDTTP